MSIPRRPEPAKLVVGCFMHDKGLFAEVVRPLADSFGAVDVVSPWFAFHETRYYEKEMGAPLFRRFAVFSDLIAQEMLPDIKQFTNTLERRYSQAQGRTINIDPGYLSAERFVLATGKNFTHRIYLKDGIYADLTLIYHKGGFRPLEWTYPDYGGGAIRAFLETVRNRYLFQMKQTMSERS